MKPLTGFFGLLLVLLCAAPASSFQAIRTISPARNQQQITSIRNIRRSTHLAAVVDENKNESETETEDEVTDLDKATFDIAKEYAQTGIPDDSKKSSGFKLDAPTV